MKYTRALLALLVSLCILRVHTQSTTSPPPPRTHLRTCYLMFGPISDLGYTFSHNKGRMAAHKRFSLDFPNITLESRYVQFAGFQTPEKQTAITQAFVDTGCEVIHGTYDTYSILKPFVEKYPNITFSTGAGGGGGWPHQPGIKYHPNLVRFERRSYQKWYQAGIVAAMTRKRCIGWIPSWMNHRTHWSVVMNHYAPMSSVSAFVLGVQSILPNETVHILSVESWYDPDRAAVAAEALHKGLGCDILFQYSDAFEAAQYAEANDIMSIQMHGIASEYHGDNVLTCIYSNWTSLYYNMSVDRALGRAR